MKKRGRRRAARAAVWNELRDGFVKGFVSTGLLVALRDAGDSRRVLRAALQGGTALAAASVAAGAVGRRAPTTALTAVAAGALGLCLVDRLSEAEAGSADEAAAPANH